MRAFILLLLLGIFSNPAFSQAKTSINDIRNIFDEKGDYYFDRKEYKKAIIYFNMAFKHDAKNYYSVLRKAETYTKMGLLDQAAECYRTIFETDLYIPNEFRLQFALLLFKNKDIKGFDQWMGKYNEIVYTEISDKGYLSDAEVRAKMYKDSSFVLVENENILNTPESEICPTIFKDIITFASTRKNLAGSSANNFYNMFSASYVSGGQLGKLNYYSKSLNSAQNERRITFSESTKKLYLTRGSSATSGLKTFVASMPSSPGSLIETRELSIDGIGTIGYPTISSDGLKMYFVSDAPGGSGGLDIYSCEWKGGKWSNPQNLGSKINSAKDDMYPYLLNDTLLFFSSSGHRGQGGIDLYSVNPENENSTPKNLGPKVNSKYDDYGLTFSEGGYTGYFCSNRPGGLGKEDIYRLHLLDIKVKHAAYRFKRRTSMEDDKINLYLDDGEEYNIASEDNSGFNFTFHPQENYKMVIQHENPIASNIIYSTKLSGNQKRKEFLNPKPFNKSEIKLQAGMKYQFTAGMKPISKTYKDALTDLSKEYQSASNKIDLTALAKELLLRKGEVYTIRFVKDDSRPAPAKSKEETSLKMNDKTVNVQGRAFFIMLPLDIEANFNIKTDLGHFKETYSPKKIGKVKVDDAPVIKEEPVKKVSGGFPILVNTESLAQASRKVEATELTIIPGTMYILTLGRKNQAKGKAPELVVPLTKGVKYNLGTTSQSQAEYNKALTQMMAGQPRSKNEELIDISVLSKEMDIDSDESIIFNLIPATKIATQTTGSNNVLSTLDVDGRKYYVTSRQKLQVLLKLKENERINIQTDLSYVKENFVPSTISLKVDTTSFSKNVITDPVFDVIVVNFNLNEYSIRPDAKTIIENKVIQELRKDSRLYVTIKGYTDPLGDAAYNEKLSRNRAQSVKDFLTNNGIGDTRIRTFSYGESMALDKGVKWEDLSEEELKKHRKVEIVMYLPKEK
jgi:outer membrane protein OmpA-like peptidoglycan-associated protein/tetratricopeptide (TPR) repeat protein